MKSRNPEHIPAYVIEFNALNCLVQVLLPVHKSTRACSLAISVKMVCLIPYVQCCMYIINAWRVCGSKRSCSDSQIKVQTKVEISVVFLNMNTHQFNRNLPFHILCCVALTGTDDLLINSFVQISVIFLAHLAWMPKSVCNYELSFMCLHHHCHRCRMWTVLLSTHLTMEVSPFTKRCIYETGIGFPKIGHSDLKFSNGSHFTYFLNVHLLPTFMFRDFIFGTVVHLY